MSEAARKHAQNAQMVQEIVLSVVPKHEAFQLFLWKSKQLTFGLLNKDPHQPHWYMVWFLNLSIHLPDYFFLLYFMLWKHSDGYDSV